MQVNSSRLIIKKDTVTPPSSPAIYGSSFDSYGSWKSVRVENKSKADE